jgi:hypothetical protein
MCITLPPTVDFDPIFRIEVVLASIQLVLLGGQGIFVAVCLLAFSRAAY